MAYDIPQQQLITTIDGSDLPDPIKQAIAREIGDIIGDVNVETIDASDEPFEIGDSVDVVEITGDGTYNAGGTKVILVNSDEDTEINYTSGQGDDPFVIVGGGGNDRIVVTDDGDGSPGAAIEGGNGDDSITGASGDDQISGGVGDDSIDAGDGNDVITLGDGNDSIEGGSGFDVARVEGGRSSYTVTVNADGDIEVTDADGETDVLDGVEFVEFDDGTILAAVEDQETGSVARLYEAVFDREADGDGYNFWVESFEAGAVTLEEIAQAFLNSEEDGGDTNDLSDSDFVNDLYQSFLNRDADTAGFVFYLDLLNRGVGRETIIADFAGSAEGTEEYDYIQVVGDGKTDFDFS